MKKVVYDGREFEIPSVLEELNPDRYEYLCMLSYGLGTGAISPERVRLKWFAFLLGYGGLDYSFLKRERIEDLERESGAVDGFFTGSGDDIRIRLDTVVNLLPEYMGFRGPGNLLQGITFGEFTECYSILEALEGAGPEELEAGYRQVARTLYHVPEEREVPDFLLFHAPKLFGNVWQAIQSGPIEVGGKKIDFRIIFKSSGEKRPDDRTGWTGITFEVASAGLFGNVDKVERTDFWTVLLYLYKCKFEYLNEKRNSKT